MVKTRCCYPQYGSMYVNDHRLVGLVLMYVFYRVSLSLKNGKAMLESGTSIIKRFIYKIAINLIQG